MAKPISPLPPTPVEVIEKAPPGACDTHVHILAAPGEFPLYDKRTEDPAQTFARYLSDYRQHLAALGISKGIIVQSIFYGTDNSVTVAAIEELGKGFKGIGLLTDDATDVDLDAFVASNLCGVRLNYVHGGVLTWGGLKAMAPRLAQRGLHVQMLMHADQHMLDIAKDLDGLGIPVVFDHIGWPSDMSGGPENKGFQALCTALTQGQAYVKLSGLYRVSNAPYTDTDPFVQALVAANPARCLWGSDWPHVMLNGAEMPHGHALWNAFLRAVPDPAQREQILVHNPAKLYRI